MSDEYSKARNYQHANKKIQHYTAGIQLYQSCCSLDHAPWLFHVIPCTDVSPELLLNTVAKALLTRSKKTRFYSQGIVWIAAIELLGFNTPAQVDDTEASC